MTTKTAPPFKKSGTRGPVPSGETRAEIERRSKLKSRARREEVGLVDLKAHVTTETRNQLTAMKEAWGLSNIGQVIEKIVMDYKK